MTTSEIEYSGPAAIYHKRFVAVHERLASPEVLNVSLRLEIEGPLDFGALARAASALIRRHHALRTGFRRRGGQLVQEVHRPRPVTLAVTSLETGRMSADERADAIEEWCREQASTPFEVDGAPLIRFALAQAGADHWTLMIVQHHVNTDATSTGITLSDLAVLYSAEVGRFDAGLPPPPAQQLDFARWQLARLTDDYKAELIGFWRDELDGADFDLPLPGDHPRPPHRSGDGTHLNVYLPPGLGEKLAGCARAHGATMFAVLTAAFGALLCELARRDDVVIVTPFQNRMAPEFETVVGQFANSVPLRLRSLPSETVADMIKRTARQLWALADHQELPLPEILEALQINERPGAAEFPQGFIALHPRTGQHLDMAGLKVTVADYAVPAAGTDDFGVLVVPQEQGIRLWTVAASYLGIQTARGWLDRYIELLRKFADEPAAPARDW